MAEPIGGFWSSPPSPGHIPMSKSLLILAYTYIIHNYLILAALSPSCPSLHVQAATKCCGMVDAVVLYYWAGYGLLVNSLYTSWKGFVKLNHW